MLRIKCDILPSTLNCIPKPMFTKYRKHINKIAPKLSVGKKVQDYVFFLIHFKPTQMYCFMEV